MPSNKRNFPILSQCRDSVPFANTEEAWFWFIKAQQARNDGARVSAGFSLIPRPCEPLDILKIADRLYRNRLLGMDHFYVLKFYGQRGYAPDPRRIKEQRAHRLWIEAMARLEPVFLRKGIVGAPKNNAGNTDCGDAQPCAGWITEMRVYEQGLRL
ncbi:MAG: hypothetical protein ACK4VI_01090 [Alphaproteobacteria bacterium]